VWQYKVPINMKKPRFFTVIALYALVAEGLPIVVQFLSVILKNAFSSGAIYFNESFMNTSGFYVFQIVGFYLTFIMFYLLLVRLRGRNVIQASLLFLALSIALEVVFYMINSIHFSFAYAFAFLDKFVGIVLANFTYLLFKDSFYKMFFSK
jgi:hypothetical protein